MKYFIILILCLLCLFAINDTVVSNPKNSYPKPDLSFSIYLKSCPLANSFDFPVGAPDANNYYNAQVFGQNNHLGDDWNGKGGGNTDLGDPIFSIADGIVLFADDLQGGWGNVIRICHNTGTVEQPHYIESLYAHLKDMTVRPGEIIHKGQQIGTMGNAGGMYYAHLHLEIRKQVGLPIGAGYGKNNLNYYNPTYFINRYYSYKILNNLLKRHKI